MSKASWFFFLAFCLFSERSFAVTSPWSAISVRYDVQSNDLAKAKEPISFELKVCDLHRSKCSQTVKSEVTKIASQDKAISVSLSIDLKKSQLDDLARNIGLKLEDAYLDFKPTGRFEGDFLEPFERLAMRYGTGASVITNFDHTDRRTGIVTAMYTTARVH